MFRVFSGVDRLPIEVECQQVWWRENDSHAQITAVDSWHLSD